MGDVVPLSTLVQKNRPTIYDVAKRALVSTATVSKVLRGVTTVSQDNSDRVHAAVRELGYRSDPLAANLRRNTRNIVGLVVPDFRNPFFGSLIAMIEQQAEASGYRLVTVSSAEEEVSERQQIDALLDWRVAGILLIPHTTAAGSHEPLREGGVPTVFLDRVPRNGMFDGVGVDNAHSCYEMVRRFHELGHRKLLVALSSTDLPNMAERLAGVLRAVEDISGEIEIELLACGTHGMEEASRAMETRFARGDYPTAIFTLFNPATLAALREIAKGGLTVPDDVSIAGFDDSEWMQVMHPPIAAIVQPIEAMAREAWARLMARIADPEGTRGRLELPCNVEFRGSLAQAKNSPVERRSQPRRSGGIADLNNKTRKR